MSESRTEDMQSGLIFAAASQKCTGNGAWRLEHDWATLEMPLLTLEHNVTARPDRILGALGRIDQFQSFIPGCTQIELISVETLDAGVWEGRARYTFEVKKIGIHEQAEFHFWINEAERTVRFKITEADGAPMTFDARYCVEERAPHGSVVKATFQYKSSRKRYAWLIAKPLIKRFFGKFMSLIEERALHTHLPLDFSVQPDPVASPVAKAHHHFAHADEISHAARVRVLDHFPKGSIGAEIGTYMGAFAEQIITNVRPAKLYLIDPWIALNSSQQSGSWYETVDQEYMDQVFRMVCDRFAAEAATSNVIILREYSDKALSALDDETLDWAYIDGDHSYPAVCRDLELCFAKVRSGGYIAGDDHAVVQQWWKDSVVRAVREFRRTHPVDLILEEGAQFLLRKH